MKPTGGGRWQVPLLGVMAGSSVADINISSTALVDAIRGLAIPETAVPVASSAMSIVLAATVISSGLLADRIGRRRLLMLALTIGVAGELITAASVNTWMYIAGRAVVGIAVGAVFTASFTSVRAVSTPATLGSALGMFGAVSGLAMLTVSFIGGSLATANWRASFLIVPTVYAICLVLVPRILPVQPPIGEGPVDALGQVLLAIGIVGPLYAVSQLTSPSIGITTIAAFLIGVIAFVAFYLYERRNENAFFPVELFTNRAFLACILMSIGVNMSNSVMVLQLANLWQYVLRMSTVEVAIAQVPALATSIVASIIVGKALSRGWRERRLGLMGFALVALGFASLALYRSGLSFWFFVPALLLVGGGAQVINVPFGSLLMKTAPPASIGPVTASRSAIGSFGNALGMAGSTVLIARFTRADFLHELDRSGATSLDKGQALDAVTVYIRSGHIPGIESLRHALTVAGASYSEAFAITMGVVAAVVVLMGLGVALLLRRSATAAPAASPAQ